MTDTCNRLKLTFPTLNEREQTVDDFYLAADLRQVEIFEARLKRRGYWAFDLEERQDYIFLKKEINKLKWLETALHEMFHACGCNEFEANAFRLVALIPLPLLADKWCWLELNPTLYARKLWNEREKVYFLFGV